ncbi:MAG: flagellar hook-length control protein FliK [Burkholderiales bacterium]|nr:flagellar hook-length control protein FliK [Burkholderiales bacterium]
MNLNSYLSLPTPPRVATQAADSPLQGTVSGADMVAGHSLGLDFAQIMAKQLQQLPSAQRQNFAASSAPSPAETGQAKRQVESAADKDYPEETTSQDKPTPQKIERQSQESPGQAKENKQESSTKTSPGTSPRSRKASTQAEEQDAATVAPSPWRGDLPQPLALAGSATPALASVSTHPVANPAAQELNHSTDSSMDKLQTIALSPKVHIITDPRQAPSSESLMEFAKSMGLDDATIQNLMGTATTHATTTTTAITASPHGVPVHSAIDLLATVSNNPGASIQPPEFTPEFATAMTQALTTTVQTPVANANLLQTSAAAPLNFGISALPANGLSQADMAAIQQIQMTVLPPAVLPVQIGNTAQTAMVQSTASVLSLLGGNMLEQDIANLASTFSEDKGGQGDASGSENAEQSSSGFAQALAQSSASDSRAMANKEVANAVATPLHEVYDQLSDKLATEMAARMHKQLSDGQWKMKFGLRPAHLGGVEIQLEMKDGKLDAVFRAENPMTRDLLQNSTQRLREALQNFGINAGFVQVGQNPGQSHQNPSGNSTPQPQVGDNSKLNTNTNDTAKQVVVNRSNGSTSLLDLYA